MPTAAGYLHPAYARSLAEFGTPLALDRSGGWVLERPIPGSGMSDLTGCYPLFSCMDWRALAGDLAALERRLVSLTVVADPFGDYTVEELEQTFTRVVPFKKRLIADLSTPAAARVSRHHRRAAAQARRRLDVAVCPDPLRYLDEWVSLYAHIVERHGLSGIRAFSRRAFEQQLAVPGLVMVRAVKDGVAIGMTLWFERDDVAYGHLAGMTAEGYRLGAAYAMYWVACEWLATRVRWLDLGGVAGAAAATGGGLDFFKRGWATGTRQTYLCGRVLHQPEYDRLTALRGATGSTYWPAYRAGEFD